MKDKQGKFISILVGILITCLIAWSIYRQINEHYAQDDPKLQELKKKFEQFFNQDRYWESPLEMLNKKNIMSEISLYRGNKSYTINKEKVFICLKNEKGQYYNDNMLIFVLAHELSHALCDEIGHTEKFHVIFEGLLLKLTESGIYNPSIPVIQDYCEKGDDEV